MCFGVFEAEHLPAAIFPAVVFLVVIHDATFVFDTNAALADDFNVADDGDVLSVGRCFKLPCGEVEEVQFIG